MRVNSRVPRSIYALKTERAASRFLNRRPDYRSVVTQSAPKGSRINAVIVVDYILDQTVQRRSRKGRIQ